MVRRLMRVVLEDVVGNRLRIEGDTSRRTNKNLDMCAVRGGDGSRIAPIMY